MYLSYRTAKLGDLEDGCRLIHDGFLHAGKNRDWLLAFWYEVLFKEQSALSIVIEDHQRPAGKRAVAFGLSLFITDEFATSLKNGLPPYVSSQVIRQWRRARRVFLGPREIARGNEEGGLNLLLLHYGWGRTGLSRDETLEVRFEWPKAFLAFHRGYQVKEFFKEVYGPEEKASMDRFGFVLRRSHPGLPQGNGSPPQPYLYGITREEGRYCESNYWMAQMFNCPACRFRFSLGEKEVLQKALTGETDEDIAAALGLCLWTVKKRWQGVYAKVERADPMFLASLGREEAEAGRPRPNKKRPHLLEYLRLHPEEIRPGFSPARAGLFPATKHAVPIPPALPSPLPAGSTLGATR